MRDCMLHPAGQADAQPAPGEGRLRITALKPFTYSTMHLIVAVSVAYVLTRDWRVALGVGLLEPLVQTFAYIAHERVWARFVRRRGAAAAASLPAGAGGNA